MELRERGRSSPRKIINYFHPHHYRVWVNHRLGNVTHSMRYCALHVSNQIRFTIVVRKVSRMQRSRLRGTRF
jgi:hypothetical protein